MIKELHMYRDKKCHDLYTGMTRVMGWRQMGQFETKQEHSVQHNMWQQSKNKVQRSRSRQITQMSSGVQVREEGSSSKRSEPVDDLLLKGFAEGAAAAQLWDEPRTRVALDAA